MKRIPGKAGPPFRKQLNISFPLVYIARLNKEAGESGRSEAEIVRCAVDQYFIKMDNGHDVDAIFDLLDRYFLRQDRLTPRKRIARKKRSAGQASLNIAA